MTGPLPYPLMAMDVHVIHCTAKADAGHDFPVLQSTPFWNMVQDGYIKEGLHGVIAVHLMSAI